ncbi:hypothetical protein SOVF_043730 isoform B [Spinacia oleracea]|nr:hypothetical protein SOVF_043730 isoform B [Spinacia oleracea]
MLADQMINRVELVHSKSFLHRDIKPDNFLMGLGRRAIRSIETVQPINIFLIVLHFYVGSFQVLLDQALGCLMVLVTDNLVSSYIIIFFCS